GRRPHRRLQLVWRGLRQRGRRRVLAQDRARVRRGARAGVASGVTRAPAPTTVSVVVALALAGIAGAASAADAPTWREGRLGDADFVIGLPAKWNGGLVKFAHGYQGEGRGRGDVQSSPLGGQVTARGYAWAASGYRAHGYRPDWFLADTLALRDHVIKELGQPRWTIIHGQSMGGHVAIASLELYPEVYQGGLIERGGGDG